ncbi:hypothetical protein FNF28_05969 [Cafeteria roenbergensis]|uniref:Deacetylase sirtuin-type domain-containing protein n=1 Tax=Cafeteria roenbergensis TaxID=33653 RepID=A0A5A8D1V3_CAFRO|nr:hypothetical protein FNF28_05969 [Cafeteria roenbergensis]
MTTPRLAPPLIYQHYCVRMGVDPATAASELGLPAPLDPESAWGDLIDAYLSRINAARKPLSLSQLRGVAERAGPHGLPVADLTIAADPLPDADGEALLSLAAALISGARRIVVLVGAGISVSCGIPDFRSPRTGLYDVIRAAGIDGLNEPQEIFDLAVFDADPQVFFAAAPVLLAHFATTRPSYTHFFLAVLASRRRLRRLFSQNVDGLERVAGVPRDDVVACHGTLATFSCRKPKCSHTVDTSEILPLVLAPSASKSAPRAVISPRSADGSAGPAASPSASPTPSQGPAGKAAAAGEPRRARECGGAMKPGIVFFGEELPAAYDSTVVQDLAAADLFVAMGTSMRVRPAGGMLECLRPGVPAILVNAEDLRTVSKGAFDLTLRGQSDVVCAALAGRIAGMGEAVDAAVEEAERARDSGPGASGPKRFRMAVASTATYGGVVSACATALTTTGLVLPAWTTSSVGDAVVESGLWAVCSRNVPFITDQCDGIIEPSSSVMVARWLSILQCVVGFAAILLSVTTVTVLPYSVMLFVTLVVTLGAAALGVLAVISFASTAHPVVLASTMTQYGPAFLTFNAGWVCFLFGAALGIHAYVLKRREAVPASINRKGWAAAKRAGRAMGRASGGRR